MRYRNLLSIFMSALVLAMFSSCSDDDDSDMDIAGEFINQVTLTFSPTSGGIPLVFIFNDPDGDGAAAPTQDDIVLTAGSSYNLEITLENTINGEDVTEEIKEEDDEHMIFFGWTQGLFSVPGGDGNIGQGNADDPIVYADFDANLNPLGILTTWVAGEAASGTFTILLKHQPNLKTADSDSTVGETDIELLWNIEIE